jgi:hypothetical protein
VNNQTNGNGGTSPDLQPMIDPASNDLSGQAPPVASMTSTSVPVDVTSQSGTSGTIGIDSVKTGHD